MVSFCMELRLRRYAHAQPPTGLRTVLLLLGLFGLFLYLNQPILCPRHLVQLCPQPRDGLIQWFQTFDFGLQSFEFEIKQT